MKYLNSFWLSFVLIYPFLTGCVPMFAIGTAAGTGTYISEDRRTSGMFIEDEGIELKVRNVSISNLATKFTSM